MNEVQNKWSALKLNDDIWAKLIYFEQNRRLAKAYVSTPVLTVDGSSHGLDGFRIGLSGIDNTYRSLDSISCLRSMGAGVKLKIDGGGNILIRRVSSPAQEPGVNRCRAPVWVKDWSWSAQKLTGPPSSCVMQQIHDTSFRLFDMGKFRSHLDTLRQANHTNHIDWRQCVSVISFGAKTGAKPSANILNDPCWIMLINIIAIEMIKSSLLAGRVSPSLSTQPSSIDYPHTRHNNNSHTSYNNNPKLPPNRYNNHHQLPASSLLLFPSSSSSNLPDKLFSNTLSSINNNNNNLESNKKFRTARQPLPLQEISHNGSRRYQSIQQLPLAASHVGANTSSSTIYTTFQSKSRGKHLLNRSPTTDNFNFDDLNQPGSLQTSKNHRSGHLLPPGSRDNLTNSLLEHHDKALFSRKSLVLGPQFNSTTTKSLSTIELFSDPERLELQSSCIKMNYDQLGSPICQHRVSSGRTAKPFFDHSELAFVRQLRGPQRCDYKQNLAPTKGSDNQGSARLHKKQLPSPESCLCESCKLPVVRRHLLNKQPESVYKPTGGACLSHMVDGGQANQSEAKSSATSSIDSSSSSSSGCADADYFMTQSSVSSCSAASNELSSQPPSSSGIVCSENPSDVCEDEHDSSKPAPVVGLTKHANCSSEIAQMSTSDSRATNALHGNDIPNKKKLAAHGSRPNRRKLDPKTIELPFNCCCRDVLETTPERDEHDNDSLCPMLDCGCHCYCLFCNNQLQQQPLHADLSDCDCREILAKNRSQRSTTTTKTYIDRHLSDSLLALNSKQAHPNAKAIKSSTLDAKSTTLNKGNDEASPSATNGQPKHSIGWLNRKNYGKILPKFMFSSSSASSRQLKLLTSSKEDKKTTFA